MRPSRRLMSAKARLVGIVLGVLVVFGVALLAITIALLADQLPQVLDATSGSSSGAPGGLQAPIPPSPGGAMTPGIAVTVEPESPSSALPASEGVTLTVPSGDLETYWPKLRRLVILDGGLALLITAVAAGFLGWWLAGRILRPLRRMVSVSRRIGDHTLSERVPVAVADDEFGELAIELNAMLERLESGYRREQMLSSAASHELYTPMAAQRTLLEVTLSDPDADAAALRTACEVVLDQNRQLERITQAVLTLGRTRDAQREGVVPVRIDQAILRMIDELEARDLTITTRLDSVTLEVNPVSVEALLRNLVGNALNHNEPDGWIKVDLRRGRPDDLESVATLTITNSCRPVDPRLLSELGTPFRRGGTRTSASASVGLGLAIVNAIAKLYHWRVSIDAPTPGTFAVTVDFGSGRGSTGEPAIAEDEAARHRVDRQGRLHRAG